MGQVFASQPVQMDDLCQTLHRNGYEEEGHFAFSYTPIPGAAGSGTEGLFCACDETTLQVRAETDPLRRLTLPEERRTRYVGDMSEMADRAVKLTGQMLAPGYSQVLAQDAGHGFELLHVPYALDMGMGARCRGRPYYQARSQYI